MSAGADAPLASQTMVMFLCRVLFFRLHESAKYLVAAERPSAAVIALQRISRINGKEAKWDLQDVVDDEVSALANDVDASDGKLSPPSYAATGETTPESRPKSASPSLLPTSPLGRDADNDVDEESADLSTFSLPSSVFSSTLATSRLRKDRPAWIDRLPVSWRSGADDYLARLDELLEPRWRRTTTLIWVIWTLASAGYTVRFFPCTRLRRLLTIASVQIFNVFLPKFLETKLSDGGQPSSQEATLRDCEFCSGLRDAPVPTNLPRLQMFSTPFPACPARFSAPTSSRRLSVAQRLSPSRRSSRRPGPSSLSSSPRK